MPKTHRINRKRHGKHHQRSKEYVKTYLPYLPLVVSLLSSIFLTFRQPSLQANTLAYATEMSQSGLLASTNSQRAANGVGSLALNAQLNNAAQAKANDMIARNYWSHTTPDGQQPWVFVDNAGYKYAKAGENLAYGFATSSSTVTGWMNSATHKANMLDGAFSDVGFGFANGGSYNNAGEQTVVVAMYGKPQTLGASTPAPAAPTASTPKASTPAPTPAPAAAAPTPVAEAAPTPEPTKEEPQPITTDLPVAAAQPASQEIAQVQTVTGGRAPWTLAVITFALAATIIFWMAHHTLRLRHLLKDGNKLLHKGERYILHHPLLDATLLSFTVLGIILTRTAGIIL
jgi:uncharacterized protein YkwD